jgi:hypothetical protein
MNPPKTTEASSTRSSTTTTVSQSARKPWKKKTPADVVLDQINKVRDDVASREEELKQAKRQLQKLEEARKVLEAT